MTIPYEVHEWDAENAKLTQVIVLWRQALGRLALLLVRASLFLLLIRYSPPPVVLAAPLGGDFVQPRLAVRRQQPHPAVAIRCPQLNEVLQALRPRGDAVAAPRVGAHGARSARVDQDIVRDVP